MSLKQKFRRNAKRTQLVALGRLRRSPFFSGLNESDRATVLTKAAGKAASLFHLRDQVRRERERRRLKVPRAAGPLLAQINRDNAEFWRSPDAQRAAEMRAVTWAATAKPEAAAARRRQDLADARKRTNLKRAKKADKTVRDKFRTWQNGVESQLIGKGAPVRLDLYLKTQRPPIRERRRLCALLKAGKL